MSSYGSFAQKASIMDTIALQSGATGNGDGVKLPVTGYSTALLHITASTAMSGGTTINFEVSTDDSAWVAITGSQVGTTNSGTTTTTTGDWAFNITGYKSIRARISAYSAGNITVTGFVSVLVGSSVGGGSGSSISSVVPGTGSTNLGKAEDAAHASGDTGVFILGVRDDSLTTFCSANGDYSPIAVDQYGRLKMVYSAAAPSPVSMYRATTGFFTPATSATDMATIYYGGSGTIRILAIYANYTVANANTAVYNNFFLIKRTGANTGSPTGDTEIANSTANSSPNATVAHWTSTTGNPSALGSTTNGGVIDVITLVPLASGGNNYAQSRRLTLYEAEPDAQGTRQGLVLRASNEGICVGNSGTSSGITVAGTTPSVCFTFVWSEE